MPMVNFTRAELEALIDRSRRHTGIKDSKDFERAYNKLLEAQALKSKPSQAAEGEKEEA